MTGHSVRASHWITRIGLADPAALGLFIARGLQLAIGFAISIVLVRHFGLTEAGTYALASLPGAMANFFCALGLGSALSRLPLSNGKRATVGLLATFATYPIIAACCFIYGLLEGQDASDSRAIALIAFGAGALGQVTVQQGLYVLQRRGEWAPLAIIVQLMGVAAAAACPTFADFVSVLTVSRLLACVIGFVPLRYARISFAQFRLAVVAGLQFVPLDLALMLSEVLPIAFLPIFLTRDQIGLLGLARQFVTVADTPGWSLVQAHYPSLVSDIYGNGPVVARKNNLLALWAIAGVTVTAVVMTLGVYRVPSLIPVLLAMLVVTPVRYAGYFYDQTLRATGKIIECTKLAVAKIALSAALYFCLCAALGFWGAVLSFALLSIGSTSLYRVRLTFHFPTLLTPLRSWRLS